MVWDGIMLYKCWRVGTFMSIAVYCVSIVVQFLLIEDVCIFFVHILCAFLLCGST